MFTGVAAATGTLRGLQSDCTAPVEQKKVPLPNDPGIVHVPWSSPGVDVPEAVLLTFTRRGRPGPRLVSRVLHVIGWPTSATSVAAAHAVPIVKDDVSSKIGATSVISTVMS